MHIVHQIVTELLGGRIEVVSPPPEGSGGARRTGTLMTIILPRIAPLSQTPPAPQQ